MIVLPLPLIRQRLTVILFYRARASVFGGEDPVVVVLLTRCLDGFEDFDNVVQRRLELPLKLTHD
jgi:hypothetical protein